MLKKAHKEKSPRMGNVYGTNLPVKYFLKGKQLEKQNTFPSMKLLPLAERRGAVGNITYFSGYFKIGIENNSKHLQ